MTWASRLAEHGHGRPYGVTARTAAGVEATDWLEEEGSDAGSRMACTAAR
jgi:hypothetical protein